jgi:hypothetical protein
MVISDKDGKLLEGAELHKAITEAQEGERKLYPPIDP